MHDGMYEITPVQRALAGVIYMCLCLHVWNNPSTACTCWGYMHICMFAYVCVHVCIYGMTPVQRALAGVICMMCVYAIK